MENSKVAQLDRTYNLGFWNNKGGTGKTTVSVNLAYGLALKGYKVAFIDWDPQGNGTAHLGFIADKLNANVSDIIDVLKTGLATDDEILNIIDIVMINTDFGIDLIPANLKLVESKENLGNVPNKSELLKQLIEFLEDEYDYDFIIVDCPPSIDTLTWNALTAVEYVIPVLEPAFFSTLGVEQLTKTIRKTINSTNKSLKIAGTVLNRFDSRLNDHKEAKSDIQNTPLIGDTLFSTHIRQLKDISTASKNQAPVLFMANEQKKEGGKSYINKGEKDFQDLVDELLVKLNVGA